MKDRSKWTEYIPLVRRIINSSIHSATGFRPSEMLFGSSIDLNKGLLPVGEGEIVSHVMQKRHEEILALAAKSQKELDAKHMAERNPRSFTEYKIGDYVLTEYKSGKPDSKLHPKRLGPFTVVGRNGNNYDLQNCVTNKQYTYHIKKIHPFYWDKREVDPTKVAMMDNSFYEVLKVDSHKFIGNKKQIKDNLELFMQFEDDPEPTWYGWNSTYNDVAVIQDYFKKNNLKHFVLDRYK